MVRKRREPAIKIEQLEAVRGISKAAAAALIDLAGRNAILKPDAVVDAARDPASPLHRYFEWDDTAAAQAHRREQARHLIKKVKVIVTSNGSAEPVSVRAFVSDGEGAHRFVRIDRALADNETRIKVVDMARAEFDEGEQKLSGILTAAGSPHKLRPMTYEEAIARVRNAKRRCTQPIRKLRDGHSCGACTACLNNQAFDMACAALQRVAEEERSR